MKAIELLKIGRVLLELLSNSGIRTDDFKYIQLYEDYLELRRKGEKYEYTTTLLSERYKLSQRTVSRLIQRLGKDCQ